MTFVTLIGLIIILHSHFYRLSIFYLSKVIGHCPLKKFAFALPLLLHSVHQGLRRLGVAGDSSCAYVLPIVLVTASYDNHLLVMRCMSDIGEKENR